MAAFRSLGVREMIEPLDAQRLCAHPDGADPVPRRQNREPIEEREIRVNQQSPSPQIGTIGWTERTGGVLTVPERIALARPLLRGLRGIIVGRLAMATRTHSGRRNSVTAGKPCSSGWID